MWRGSGAAFAVCLAGLVLGACSGSGGHPSAETADTSAPPPAEAPEQDLVTPASAAGTETAQSEPDPRVPKKLRPLFGDHNDLDADRINLVLAASNWNDREAFIGYARTILTWDGEPLMLDFDLLPTEMPEAAVGLAFGVFSIEPWRSNRDLFNVWYLTKDVADPARFLNTDREVSGLPHELVIFVTRDFEFDSVAGVQSFLPPELPKRDGSQEFGDVILDVPSEVPYVAVTTLAHELGHAMFGLADEYVGDVFGYDGRLDLSSYPACAADWTEAESWWGDLEGDVDPMFDIWMDELEEAGLAYDDPYEQDLRESVAVTYVHGGCYDRPRSYRATVDSLMNGEIPVLGSVNRRFAERVLDLWEGSG